jgi:hypothetical protein
LGSAYVTLSVKVPESMAQALVAAAEASNTSLSETIRSYLTFSMEQLPHE